MIPILPFGGGGGAFAIARSLRTRGGANAGLYRNVAASTNRRTMTLARWFKLGALGANFVLWQGYANASNYSTILVAAGGSLRFHQASGGVDVALAVAAAALRDPGAWYHVVVQIDTTDAAAANRMRVWVNGVALPVSGGAPGLPAHNLDTHFNVSGHRIGFGYDATVYGAQTDGLHAALHFVDGQLIAPGAFGAINPATGAWVPARYDGGHGGANGAFHDFRDASSASALGFDYSGNGNHLTPSGVSVGAGVDFDQSTDTPTDNCATLNPLASSNGAAIFAANLCVTNGAAGAWRMASGSFAVASGKFYVEFGNPAVATATYATFGFVPVSAATGAYPASPLALYSTQSGDPSGVNYSLAIDFDAGKWWVRRNGGAWIGGGDPAAGTAPYGVFAAGTEGVPYAGCYDASVIAANFGQQPFAYAPPVGFQALRTRALPPPPIKRGDDAFRVLARAGAGAVATVTGTRFAPDLVWIKRRNAAADHRLYDRVRGGGRQLYPNAASAENVSNAGLTAFAADGYAFGAPGGDPAENAAGGAYVDWMWRKGPGAGLDIVAYTGTGSARNVPHALGAAPHFMLVKHRAAPGGHVSWAVYHRDAHASPASGCLFLDRSAGFAADGSVWSGTPPTSAEFAVGANLSAAAGAYVAYLWTAIPGFSRFGAYAGNGVAEGPFVWCGFRPRFVLIKRADGAGDWRIRDTGREPFNASSLDLVANANAAEMSSNDLDQLSNGFKLRNLGGDWNASGGTYIFAAFAETPFKYANAR